MVLKDKKTNITFHNGILTIGGTIIEVSYADSHIFFDFGSEFDPAISPQPSELQDLIDSKLVPFINNIFDPSISLSHTSTENLHKDTAVFLSHVHLDHTKIINYLDPSIPLYALNGTKSLLQTLNIDDDFLFPLKNKVGDENTREIIGVDDNETITVGDISVKLMPVDHDAYGSCGMLITTPDLVISYTGDLRLHGYRTNDTIDFCKESKHCDVLLIEGVSVSFQELDDTSEDEDNGTEQTLLNSFVDLVNSHEHKQITFNYYIANIERIVHIINNVNRTVVLDAYSAYVLRHATNKDTYYYNLSDNKYDLNPDYEVSFDELLSDDCKYIWQLSPLALEHIDKLKKGGIYIHSNAVPLGEFDPKYKPFVESFANNDIEFVTLSCSGHAHPHDLIKIINLIEPKLLVPIHSYHPERLYNNHGDVLLPEKNQTI